MPSGQFADRSFNPVAGPHTLLEDLGSLFSASCLHQGVMFTHRKGAMLLVLA